MYSFLEYRLIREVLDVANAPTDDITLHDHEMGRLYYKFQDQDGDEYQVAFYPRSFPLSELEMIGITQRVSGFSINFTSNMRGSQLTGKHKAPTIYKQLLLAVKKLLDTKKPDMLTFYGSVPSQDLMYGKFIKRFLSDAPGKLAHQVFYPIDNETLISKEFVSKLPLDDQNKVQSLVSRATQSRVIFSQSIRNRKQLSRTQALNQNPGGNNDDVW